MNHIVYLDHKDKELENILAGSKTMIVRGAMGKKLPYDRVNVGDILYLVENNGNGQIKATTQVKSVFQSDKLDKTQSIELIDNHQNQHLLGSRLLKRFSGKRYIILITIENVSQIKPFKFNRAKFGNMDDWIPFENIMDITN